MSLLLWPWDKQGSKPYFTNDTHEWWLESGLWRQDEFPNVVPFILRNLETKKADLRVLMDKESNNIIWEGTGLEGQAAFMDMLHLKKIHS